MGEHDGIEIIVAAMVLLSGVSRHCIKGVADRCRLYGRECSRQRMLAFIGRAKSAVRSCAIRATQSTPVSGCRCSLAVSSITVDGFRFGVQCRRSAPVTSTVDLARPQRG